MVLYFKNSLGQRREIGQGKSEQEIFQIINKFLEEHNFTSYYTRFWINPKNSLEKIYDVGSHTEFFICYNPGGWNEAGL